MAENQHALIGLSAGNSDVASAKGSAEYSPGYTIVAEDIMQFALATGTGATAETDGDTATAVAGKDGAAVAVGGIDSLEYELPGLSGGNSGYSPGYTVVAEGIMQFGLATGTGATAETDGDTTTAVAGTDGAAVVVGEIPNLEFQFQLIA